MQQPSNYHPTFPRQGTDGAYYNYQQQQPPPASYHQVVSVPPSSFAAEPYYPAGATGGFAGGAEGPAASSHASSGSEHSVQGSAGWQQRDFVHQRYLAFRPPQAQDKPPPTPSDLPSSNPWLGVSDMERLLVSCCQRDGGIESSAVASASETVVTQEVTHHPQHKMFSGDDDDDLPPSISGALDPNHVLRFLTIVALNCHDLASRALALAILERSLQLDQAEEESETNRRAIEAELLLVMDDTADNDSSRQVPLDEKKPPAKRKNEVLEEPSDDGKDFGGPTRRVGRSGRRIHRFLAAGGLRIMNQWLVDASTPVEKPGASSAGSTTGAAMAATAARLPRTKQASPTGQLLLPLLEFLSTIPFDKNLIKKSKINKQIRSLSKDVDSRASDPRVGPDTVHVESSGLSIRKVKEAVDQLKENWEEQAKSGAINKELFVNPLDSVQQVLLGRMQVLDSFGENGMDNEKDKPEWLRKVEELQRIKGKKKTSKVFKLSAGGTTADLARRERANERAFLMKEDLQKAQEQRRLLVIKLRELKQKNLQEEQKARHSKNKRSIRWKDGEGPASKFKKRELLEEVFTIPDRNWTDDGNADEDEVISLLDDEDPDEDMFES